MNQTTHASTAQTETLTNNLSPLCGLLQRKCACGQSAGLDGDCAGCRSKRLHIQPKLRVNQPGDRFEREADRVAEQVMRISEVETQRQTELRDEGEGVVQTKPDITPLVQRQIEEEDEDIDIQRKAHYGQTPSLTHQIASQISRSERGGQALSETTRSFYESRFGRNFSNVRIHTDTQASQLTTALQAQAFTKGNHIWLGAGAGHQPSPSRLLAHELTHVVQQVAPPLIQRLPQRPQVTQMSAEVVVQRFAPYWEPPNYNGTRTHNEMLPLISQQGSLFVEAPIPNADRLSADFDKRGSADLYQATTTAGVYFSADQTPVRLSAPRRLRYNGAGYSHRSQSAPKVGRLQNVTDVDQAPSAITVGDLKPSHGTIEALEGEGQVRNYLEGFRIAAREVNELAANNQTSPTDTQWNINSLSLFDRSQLTAMVPQSYRPPGNGQTARNVVLKQNGRAVRPLERARAKLLLTPDPQHNGILNYVWVPDLPPSFTLSPRLQALGEEVRLRIVDPLRRPPVRASIRETFDLGQWRTNRRRIRREFRALRRTSGMRDARSAALVVEAHEAIESSSGINVSEPSAQTFESARVIERLEFWTSRPAGIFGTFRRAFGRTFVKVSDAYERMRERFGGHLRRRRAPGGGGGLLGAAIKAVFSVLKMAGVLILNRTLNILSHSLVEGVSQKLRALIPEENITDLQNRVQEIQQLHTELSQQAIRSAESIVESVFPDYEATIERIQQVTEIVSNISRIVNLVRWGARAIACVSPPALGCLWALGQAVLEELAAVVVQSCWFQEKIAPLVARVSFIRQLPRRLATEIITAIRRLLPQSLHDVFADVSASAPQPNEIECDTSDGPGRPLSDDQQAILDLQERIGEERFRAFLDLVRSSGISAGVPLNRARAEQIGSFIEQNNISVEDLRRFARSSRGRPVELEQFLAQLRTARERSPVEPVRPIVGIEVPAESDEYTTVVVATREGDSGPRQPQTGEEEAGEEASGDAREERTEVREAEAQPTRRAGGARVTGWGIRIIRLRGRLVEDQVVHIDIRMSRREGRRRIVRVLRSLAVSIIEIVPSEEDERSQEAFLEVVGNQRFRISNREIYTYEEGVEFTYQFETRPQTR